MADGERYQIHCQVCFERFEGETISQAERKVREHEAQGECARPIYDGHDGVWVKGKNDGD